MKLDARIPAGPLEAKWDRHLADLRLVSPANKRKFHVIVVGSGLAGASAAAALRSGSSTRAAASAVRTAKTIQISTLAGHPLCMNRS